VTPRGQQDLEHLFRPNASEVARSKATRAVLDRERPEEPYERPLLVRCAAQVRLSGVERVIRIRCMASVNRL